MDKNEDDDENEDDDVRLKAAEQRLIATGSLVNVASPRLNAAEQQVNCDDSQVKSCVAAVKGDGLKDTQSQGDDSPATPLRLTSSSAAINRSKAAHRSLLITLSPFSFLLSDFPLSPFSFLLSSLPFHPHPKPRATRFHRFQVAMPQNKSLRVSPMQVLEQ